MNRCLPLRELSRPTRFLDCLQVSRRPTSSLKCTWTVNCWIWFRRSRGRRRQAGTDSKTDDSRRQPITKDTARRVAGSVAKAEIVPLCVSLTDSAKLSIALFPYVTCNSVTARVTSPSSLAPKVKQALVPRGHRTCPVGRQRGLRMDRRAQVRLPCLTSVRSTSSDLDRDWRHR